MIGTLGQFVREIRDLLTGGGDPIPVSVAGVEIPPLEIGGFALPAYDEFELDDEDAPTEIVYKKDGEVVATVTLVYGEGGGLLSGLITYPVED